MKVWMVLFIHRNKIKNIQEKILKIINKLEKIHFNNYLPIKKKQNNLIIIINLIIQVDLKVLIFQPKKVIKKLWEEKILFIKYFNNKIKMIKIVEKILKIKKTLLNNYLKIKKNKKNLKN